MDEGPRSGRDRREVRGDPRSQGFGQPAGLGGKGVAEALEDDRNAQQPGDLQEAPSSSNAIRTRTVARWRSAAGIVVMTRAGISQSG